MNQFSVMDLFVRLWIHYEHRLFKWAAPRSAYPFYTVCVPTEILHHAWSVEHHGKIYSICCLSAASCTVDSCLLIKETFNLILFCTFSVSHSGWRKWAEWFIYVSAAYYSASTAPSSGGGGEVMWGERAQEALGQKRHPPAGDFKGRACVLPAAAQIHLHSIYTPHPLLHPLRSSGSSSVLLSMLDRWLRQRLQIVCGIICLSAACMYLTKEGLNRRLAASCHMVVV